MFSFSGFRWCVVCFVDLFGVYMLEKAACDTARSAGFILSFLLSSKLRFFFSHCLNKYINQWRTEHYTGLSSVGKDVPPLRPHLLRFFYSGDITQLILLNLSGTRKEGFKFSALRPNWKNNLHNCWTQLKLWRCSLSSLPAKLTGFEGKWTETRRRRRRRCRGERGRHNGRFSCAVRDQKWVKRGEQQNKTSQADD